MLKDNPIIFLGIAEHIEHGIQPFPVGPLDLFRLSQHKVHLIYPAFTQNDLWVFIIGHELADIDSLGKLKIRIIDEADNLLGEAAIKQIIKSESPIEYGQDVEQGITITGWASMSLLYFKLDTLVEHPGKYIVQANWKGEYVEIGDVYYYYQPTPPLTADQIKAIESDPNSAQAISIDLGCKHCTTKLKVYTAL